MTLKLVANNSVGTSIAKAHANLAPSKAHRWLVCPGSMHVMSDDPETEWAAEGTRKHAVLEAVLNPVRAISEPVLAGDIIQTECGPYTIPLEVLEQCHEIRDYIAQYHPTHPDGWVTETETAVEIGSHIWPGTAPGECAGTCDAASYSYDELLVLDAKFGFVQVEARGNHQLLLYAAGLLAEIPYPIKWVTLCIAQPGYDGVVNFREHRMTVEQVHEWAFQQQHVVEEIKAHSHRLQAEDKACLYCPARIQCPARMKMMDDAMNEDWMKARSLEELLPYVPRLRAIAKDIEQQAMAMLNVGQPVRGWKIVAARSKRRWPEEAPVTALLASALPELQEDDPRLFEKKLKSPAQMEKALRAIFGKKLTVKESKTAVDMVAIVPTGGPKLVPESDPRPALEAATWTLEDVLNATLEAHNETD